MITGIVTKGSNISGTIKQSLDTKPTSNTVNGSISVAEMPGPEYEEYSGSYEIEPVKTLQVLATQYKLMSQELKKWQGTRYAKTTLSYKASVQICCMFMWHNISYNDTT